MKASLFFSLFALLSAGLSDGFHLMSSSHKSSIFPSGKLSTSRLGSTADSGGERTFANYVIYKSKAAVSLKVIPPTFQVSGLTGKSRTVSREGGLLFEFALASAPREYDWSKKGTFLLSAAECGELLLLDPSKPGLEFFHDPNMGGANAGQVTKKLKLTTAADTKGVFMSLLINDKAAQSVSFNVPVSWGELQVFKSIADFSIPRILGFDKVWDNPASLGGDNVPSPPTPQLYKNLFPESK